MATIIGSRLYTTYRQNLLLGTAGYDVDNTSDADAPYCALVDLDVYSYVDTHAFFSQVTGVIGGGAKPIGKIANASVVAGTFDGDNVVFISVVGAAVEGLIIYRSNAGGNATWPLVMYYDQQGGGLPITPNGGNITVTWNSAGIFTL